MPELAEWSGFYAIVGSAAGGLIGLQFIVMTLVAQNPRGLGADAGAAFATPTILHFCVVLWLSALPSVPWRVIAPFAIIWSLVGLCGVLYAVVVARRMARQQSYRPSLQDWTFHCALPLAAYLALMGFGVLALFRSREALFGVGTAVFTLLFVGIHNSWDNIVYHVFVKLPEADAASRESSSNEKDNS